MPNIGGPQSSTENAIKMAASTSSSAASRREIFWPDRVVTLLLKAVREKENLWNTKSEAYKNRNVKKNTVRVSTAGDKTRIARRLSGKPQRYAYPYYSVQIIVNLKRQYNFGPNPGLLPADEFSRALTYTYASFLHSLLFI